MMGGAQDYIAEANALAKERRLNNDYIYMLYANGYQAVVPGYSAENQQELKSVARKYDPTVIKRREEVTSGDKLFNTPISSSAASSSVASLQGSNASRINSTLVVPSSIPVREHCRQFHLLQVIPASSHQTTSPTGAYSVVFSPAAVAQMVPSPSPESKTAHHCTYPNPHPQTESGA
ncbi:hypothetical protein EKO04_011234 [Ascochyta lentis]|uniref:Uncharacterized protein n=1 Tax=Ascochyta lentis TaxID=205686 RepID=A0A8H7MBF5_9PLEO|nr:hypothetical protein EKO04_011234 [Ascochyta lentis]